MIEYVEFQMKISKNVLKELKSNIQARYMCQALYGSIDEFMVKLVDKIENLGEDRLVEFSLREEREKCQNL